MERMRRFADERFIRQFLTNLLHVGALVKERQGSEALESMASLHQYLPAYRWMLAHVPTGAKVLDWGCGNGHFSYFLQEAGYEVTPYGFQQPEIYAAAYPGRSGYVQGEDPVLLPFVDGAFDCVVSIGVLEHVREVGGDEVASLREIRRVLKDRGVFFCYHLPNKYSWIEFMSRLIGKWSHAFRYSRSEVLRIFGSAGMSVEAVSRYGVLPRNWLRKLNVLGLNRSLLLAQGVDLSDRLLQPVFGFFAQNWTLVARKTESQGGGDA